MQPDNFLFLRPLFILSWDRVSITTYEDATRPTEPILSQGAFELTRVFKFFNNGLKLTPPNNNKSNNNNNDNYNKKK